MKARELEKDMRVINTERERAADWLARCALQIVVWTSTDEWLLDVVKKTECKITRDACLEEIARRKSEK